MCIDAALACDGVLPPEPNMAKIAQSIEWATRPYAFLERCAAELGDRFTIDLGTYGAFVIVSSQREPRHEGAFPRARWR